jgi:DmsE family decaheme c-type cytochrome
MRSINLHLCGAVLFLAALGAAAQPALPAGYVGSEVCQACHGDVYEAYQKSPHHAVETEKRRGFEGRSCEACHGPGEKHIASASAADIRDPAKLPAAAADKICLTCHLNEPTHVGRLESSHMKDQVACTSCHKVHANGGHDLVVRQASAVNAQCASCHLNEWAQFQRPNHHKLPEGAMSCVDCHNPHGSVGSGMMQASLQSFGANEPGCFNCHGDKRGPFTFEHGVVRFEGCAACHEPHGSANPRMLIRQEVRFVCLECHANLPSQIATAARPVLGVVPPSFHDLTSPRYQNCTVCHQKIHGSHIDRNLLR